MLYARHWLLLRSQEQCSFTVVAEAGIGPELHLLSMRKKRSVAGSLQDLQEEWWLGGQLCTAFPDWQHVHSSPEECHSGCCWPGGRTSTRNRKSGHE